MKNFQFIDKYGFQITKYVDVSGEISSVGYGSSISSKNSLLIEVIESHEPMFIRHFRQINFDEELNIIASIIRSGYKNERYPLMSGIGQICVYKDKSYLYDVLSGGTVIENEYSLDGSLDEKSETPIMILPSKDILGILTEFRAWVAMYK